MSMDTGSVSSFYKKKRTIWSLLLLFEPGQLFNAEVKLINS